MNEMSVREVKPCRANTDAANVRKFGVVRFYSMAASLDRVGMVLLRLGLVVVLVWIGSLKFARYEAEGIVPLVANSPLMSFFYHYPAPEYRGHITKEGEINLANRQWHEANGTYPFSTCLGLVIISIGVLIALHPFSPRLAAGRCRHRDGRRRRCNCGHGFRQRQAIESRRRVPGHPARHRAVRDLRAFPPAGSVPDGRRACQQGRVVQDLRGRLSVSAQSGRKCSAERRKLRAIPCEPSGAGRRSSTRSPPRVPRFGDFR